MRTLDLYIFVLWSDWKPFKEDVCKQLWYTVASSPNGFTLLEVTFFFFCVALIIMCEEVAQWKTCNNQFNVRFKICSYKRKHFHTCGIFGTLQKCTTALILNGIEPTLLLPNNTTNKTKLSGVTGFFLIHYWIVHVFTIVKENL